MTSVLIGRKKLNKEIPEMMFLIQQQRKNLKTQKVAICKLRTEALGEAKLAHTLSFNYVVNPMDCSPPGPSVHEILQARILE